MDPIINWRTDADKALRQVALTACNEEASDETPDFAFDSRGLTTTGTPSFRPFSIQDENEIGVGTYTGGEMTIRRGVVLVASCCAALASRSELRLTPIKVIGSIAAMREIVRLRNAGVDLGRFRNGLPVYANETLVKALAAKGLACCIRKLPSKKDRNSYFDGAVPIDATEDRWVKALALWNELAGNFHGSLGSDPDTGRERTKTEICAYFVKVVKDAATSNAKKAEKRAENAAVAAVEAAETLASVDAEAPAEATETEETEAPAEVPKGKVDKVGRFDSDDWAILSLSMVEQGLDPNDPNDIAQHHMACWAVAASDDEVESAKEARAS
jgi:hypothetical protein